MNGYGYGMGPGMMGPGYGYGYGMGPGMMGPGWYGPQYGPQYQQQQKPLDKEKAKQEVENYLTSTRNPNLKLGKVTDKGSYFEADVVTKGNDSPVDKILVDRNTGWMRSAYWNVRPRESILSGAFFISLTPRKIFRTGVS
jgi:hypothetical protein